MASLDRYMQHYDHEHTSSWNKIMHAVGIPFIFAGIILLAIWRWKLGLTFFLAGWILLFVGHKIEGNKPAFFQGPVYFLVGPIWVAKEVLDALRGKRHIATSNTR